MTKPVKQVHLAAHFPGVNNTTVWSDPRSGSHIEFSSFAHLARTAERAKFDFLFLAEGLRLREQNGEIYDLDVVGRPDTFTVLAALAAVTDRLGPARTVHSPFHEPYEGGRPFAAVEPRCWLGRHFLGRVHRGELQARRLLAITTPGTSEPVPSCRPPGICSTPGAEMRSSPTRRPASSSQIGRASCRERA